MCIAWRQLNMYLQWSRDQVGIKNVRELLQRNVEHRSAFITLPLPSMMDLAPEIPAVHPGIPAVMTCRRQPPEPCMP